MQCRTTSNCTWSHPYSPDVHITQAWRTVLYDVISMQCLGEALTWDHQETNGSTPYHSCTSHQESREHPSWMQTCWNILDLLHPVAQRGACLAYTVIMEMFVDDSLVNNLDYVLVTRVRYRQACLETMWRRINMCFLRNSSVYKIWRTS